MQQGRKVRRIWPFIVLGGAAVIVVAALLILPGLLTAQNSQTNSSVIVQTEAAIGDVTTTITGSGTVAEASSSIKLPLGVTVSEVFVQSGDAVTAGDVLASIDANSVTEVINLVVEEKSALVTASASLGGSATIDRMIIAYDTVLAQLSELQSSGYIRAATSGTIGSVNIKKGDTISAATGASSNNSNDNSNGFTGVSYSFFNLAEADVPLSYQISALPYATTTVSQIQAGSTATENLTNTEALNAFLIALCQAKAWEETAPDTPTAITVDASTLIAKKGIYPVVFTSVDNPTLSATTYVIVEEDAKPSDTTPNGNTNNGGTNNAATGGTGSTNNSNLSNTSGTGSTGSANNISANNTANNSTSSEAETVVSSIMALAFEVYSGSEMEVSVQLDELDVAEVKAGQTALVELTALEGETFAGTVATVTSTDGSYYANVIFTKAEGIFSGFTATATINKEEARDVVVIPLDAVQQRGNELFVYTEASADGELSGETIIQTGLSDEITVEVTSGLAEGATVYYRQLITSGVASTGSVNNFSGQPSFNMNGGTVERIGPGGPGGSTSSAGGTAHPQFKLSS